jgi:hypothetical protein
MTLLRLSLFLAPLLALSSFCGCGASSPRPTIEGSVTYQGKPLADQTLKLHMVAEKQEDSFSHAVRIQQDGAFKGDAPRPGTYKVVIEPPRSALEGKGGNVMAIPEKYRDVKTTDLTWVIEKGRNKKDFALVD